MLFGKYVKRSVVEEQKEFADCYKRVCEKLEKARDTEIEQHAKTANELTACKLDLARYKQRDDFRAEMSAKWDAMPKHGTTKKCPKCGTSNITSGTFYKASSFVFRPPMSEKSTACAMAVHEHILVGGAVTAGAPTWYQDREPVAPPKKEVKHVDVDPMRGDSPNRVVRTCGCCGYIFCERPADGLSGIEEGK